MIFKAFVVLSRLYHHHTTTLIGLISRRRHQTVLLVINRVLKEVTTVLKYRVSCQYKELSASFHSATTTLAFRFQNKSFRNVRTQEPRLRQTFSQRIN